MEIQKPIRSSDGLRLLTNPDD
ncbi:hypothetical protein YPPY63_2951, partial [Yersinia pestis PY-63]